ncbi:uncharacterized protein LOC131427001 [Malaya genurostris]|uniref:uncharacterized protein LOC131427001 n=1 Tax=Malaya genurostris TaxID=325434 RepID=UPI0026F39BF9|nr:uncharacterized protein LOC131427001 [Malaya genurostris]
MATGIQFITNLNGDCRLCTEKNSKDNMIQCDDCDRWFHNVCAKVTVIPAANERWACIKCRLIEENLMELDQLRLDSRVPKQESGSSNQFRSDDNWIIYLKRQSLMTLPKFSGSAKEWPKFKQIYDSTTEAGAFTNLENLTRLQNVLEGYAARCVQQLMLNSENVPEIIERLEDNFGRPEFVYKELLSDIFRVKKESRIAIIELADALENLVANIEVIQKEAYLQDHRLIADIVMKLPYAVQLKWTETLQSNTRTPTLRDLSKWLKPHAATTRMMNANFHPNEKRSRVNVHEKINPECSFCKETHSLPNCGKFKRLDVSERIQFVYKQHMCLSCLKSSGHILRNCKQQKRCGINGCNRTHHPLIHDDNMRQNQKAEQPRKVESSNHHMDSKSNIYYQVIPVTLKNGEQSLDTFAFLDAGSSLTLIDEQVADKLQLKGMIDPLRLKWTQNVSRDERNSRRVHLWINGEGKKSYALKGVRTVKNLQLPTQSLDTEMIKNRYKHLRNLPVKRYSDVQPKILIGLNHTHLIDPVDRRIGKEGEPTGIKTKLGWLIYGNISGTVECGQIMIHREDNDLHRMMHDYFTTENFGVKTVAKLPESKSDERAKQIIKSTMKYVNGRFEIGLLWKEDQFQFPDSYNNAMNRLRTMENGLNKNIELKKWAIQTFNDYEEKGYIRKLTSEELKEPEARTYYLPHFIVQGKNKPKPRLVFDAAAKVKDISFNAALLSGPDSTTSLFGVLIRFREGSIAISGDIKEMFHQVKIRKEDQHAQRFLWRSCNSDADPDIYVMQVMTFGSTCSPACAQAVKNYNAELFAEKYPEASKAIVKQHYVDDYLDSFDNDEEAIQRTKQVIEIHDNASFYIRGFVSSSTICTNAIPEERRLHSGVKILEGKNNEYEKVLGVYWNPQRDELGYRLNLSSLSKDILYYHRRPTKREVASFVMSVYDPLGLVANITIRGKILLRELHKATEN